MPEEEEEGEGRAGQGEVGVPCLALYHSESGYSAFPRGLDHQDDLARRSKTNSLWRHCQIYHEAKEVPFQMTVASIHKKPKVRKCREGVAIVAGEQDILLNSKHQEPEGLWLETIDIWINVA